MKDHFPLIDRGAHKYFSTSQTWTESFVSSVYSYLFLKPNMDIAREFSMNREILCLCSDYPTIDARSFQFLEEVISKYDKRLDIDSVFLVSDAVNLTAMVKEYMEKTGRKVIAFTWRDIEGADEDYAYEVLREFLYRKNFFDQSDPVSSDGQFFARYKFIDELYDALRSGQSMGVFGLRRIGKTSVIERLVLKNDLQAQSKFTIARLDAQKPHISQSDASGVILEICREFNRVWATTYGTPFKKDGASGFLVGGARVICLFGVAGADA